MRTVLVGVLLGAGVVGASLGSGADRGQARADRALIDTQASDDRLITLSAQLGDGRQQLTVIDPQLRTMGVYHIEAASGKIELKSVRNFAWDLQLMQFNGASPQPQEVRSMVEPR